MKSYIWILGYVIVITLLSNCLGCGDGDSSYASSVHERQQRELANQQRSAKKWASDSRSQAKTNAAASRQATSARSQAHRQAQINRTSAIP